VRSPSLTAPLFFELNRWPKVALRESADHAMVQESRPT
jgi:hypothetical protein